MTTLTTAATVTLGRLQYTVQVRSVSISLAALPGIDSAQVTVAAGVRVDALPGDDAVIELDGGEGAATVLTGVVDRVERQHGGTLVSVTDAGAALAATRPSETYNGLPAMRIIAELASAAGVSTGVVAAALQTSAYVADPRRTGAQHVAELAARAGTVATIDGEGRLNVLPWPVGLPTVALRRDREFLALTTSTHAAGHEFASVGAGGAGVALAPDAWLVNTQPVTNADDPDPHRTWRADMVLRTQVDVDLANRSTATRRAAATRRLDATCWLQPARRPGDVVQVQETQHDDEAGPWLLTHVHHELAWDGAVTRLEGVTAGSVDDLLGSLAGAIGGLL